MEILEITDKKIWDDFIVAQPFFTFFQSWNWGEFNKALGNKIYRLGILREKDKLEGEGLIIMNKTKLRKSIFIPHGPVLLNNLNSEEKEKITIFFLAKVKKIARKENIDFIRLSPSFLKNEKLSLLFKKQGFILSPVPFYTENSWCLDISLPEDQLLKNMRKTTRYLIKKSWQENFEITKGTSEEELKKFYNLYQETSQKHSFFPYSYNYLKTQLETFSPDNQIAIFLVYFQKKPIAGAILIFYGNTAFYHHGGSSQKYSKIPASYALQWKAILESKKRNCKFYNFLAVSPKNKKNHPFSGITLFKSGFGGFLLEYLPTQDLPLSFKYWPRYLYEKIRKKIRGF